MSSTQLQTSNQQQHAKLSSPRALPAASRQAFLAGDAEKESSRKFRRVVSSLQAHEPQESLPKPAESRLIGKAAAPCWPSANAASLLLLSVGKRRVQAPKLGQAAGDLLQLKKQI